MSGDIDIAAKKEMREAFGGGRIPKWAEKVNTNESSANTH